MRSELARGRGVDENGDVGLFRAVTWQRWFQFDGDWLKGKQKQFLIDQ